MLIGQQSINEISYIVAEKIKNGYTPYEIADQFKLTKEQVILLAVEFGQKFEISLTKELQDYLH